MWMWVIIKSLKKNKTAKSSVPIFIPVSRLSVRPKTVNKIRYYYSFVCEKPAGWVAFWGWGRGARAGWLVRLLCCDLVIGDGEQWTHMKSERASFPFKFTCKRHLRFVSLNDNKFQLVSFHFTIDCDFDSQIAMHLNLTSKFTDY